MKPSNDEKYYRSLRCEWWVRTVGDKVLSMKIDKLYLELRNVKGYCHDYLDVRKIMDIIYSQLINLLLRFTTAGQIRDYKLHNCAVQKYPTI